MRRRREVAAWLAHISRIALRSIGAAFRRSLSAMQACAFAADRVSPNGARRGEAERRKAHQPSVRVLRRVHPGEGCFAARRSAAAIATISLETITGSGPRFAGAFAPFVSELLAAGS